MNTIKEEPGTCSGRLHSRYAQHDFQIRSLWSDSWSVLVQVGASKVQLVTKVLPFEYSHCRACDCKRMRSVIEEEVTLYTAISDECLAIRELVTEVRKRVDARMNEVLSQ